MISHESWKRGFHAAAAQKTFTVLDPEGRDSSPQEIDISLLTDSPGSGDSSAEQAGYQIDVRYKAAPDVVLFSDTYPSEDLAKRVLEDLSKAAAEVESHIKQSDFDGAQEAMQAFSKLLKSTSGTIPLADTDGGSH